ncbi:Rx, N-terminal, partial [Dillenia turbinata]
VISLLISAMGESLLAAYLQPLLDKLAPGPLMNFARQMGFHSELREWRSKLRQIKLLLGDAEEKQMNEIEVKRWLDELLLLAYDADDVLEELDHEALQRHNKSSLDSASSSSQVQDLLAQIQEITTRFRDIEEEKSDLGLKERPLVRSNIISNSLPTSSVVDSSQIVGREGDIEAILKLLDISATTKAGADANLVFGMAGWKSVVKDISNGQQCLTSLTTLGIKGCKNLRTLPDGIISSNSKLQVLEIMSCESLESFPSGFLPSTLKTLFIWDCRKLESISEMLLGSTSLDFLSFCDYPNLKILPECLCTNLTTLWIYTCESIESFPETGLPSPNLTSLVIQDCKNLKYLPRNLPKLTSLRYLYVSGCDNLVSLPEGGLPPSLQTLEFGDCEKVGKQMWDEWSPHKLPSLTCLTIRGRFRDEWDGTVLRQKKVHNEGLGFLMLNIKQVKLKVSTLL